MELIYNAPPTIARFMKDPSFVRCVVGPLGSGKTTGMGIELFRRACEQEPDSDGVRPTRFCCVRNTLQQLRDTVLPEIRQWLGPMFTFKISESKLLFNIPLPDGSRVDSEWLLMPLDTPEDVRRVLSLNLTGAWLSELREIDYEVFQGILGRCRRYPSPARVRRTWEGLIAETNPWSEGSKYHENFVLDKPPNWALFQQPGGLEPEAENREHLAADYYELLMEGHDQEWIDVYIDAKWGLDKSGQAVYRTSFKRALHVVDDLQVNPLRPLVIAQDLGRTPTCLITQSTTDGRLLVLDELTSEDMGLVQFISEVLLPKLREDRYVRCKALAVIDPAGLVKSQLREETAKDIFRSYGITCYGGMTNELAPRLRSVESLLLSLRGGRPALAIDGARCPLLCRALAHNYRYRRKKTTTAELEDTPEKNHPWSDLVDSLQYAAMSIQQNLVGRHIMANMPIPTNQFTSAAWT